MSRRAPQAVREVIADVGADKLKDTGRVIAALKSRYPGQMDFAKARRMICQRLRLIAPRRPRARALGAQRKRPGWTRAWPRAAEARGMADRSAISLEEFKARLPLAEIVGRHVKLTRRGREHLGLCPFHKEKTPSFNVVEDKGFYHCFGCGAHGNAIDFVMAIEGLDFAQALRAPGRPDRHCRRRGAAARASPGSTRRLYAANAGRRALVPGRLGAADGARGGGLSASGAASTAATIARFELGYAPDERTALQAAPCWPRAIAEATLLAAGLLVAGRRTAARASTASATGSCSRSPTSAAGSSASAAGRSARRAPST